MPPIRHATEAETREAIATAPPNIAAALERGLQARRALAASVTPALADLTDADLRSELDARAAARDLGTLRSEPAPRNPAALDRCDRNIAAHLDKFRRTMDQIAADPIGLDDSTDLQLLDELLRRTCARLQLDPDSRPAQHLLDRLMGAKTFLLTLADAEADHADR